ncbi:MAG: CHASE2 domain-containing protein [Alphaproteobacteria bacterium]|nr:CHASE2 domain-containing protein [Alphaproteobacteria bacterium]
MLALLLAGGDGPLVRLRVFGFDEVQRWAPRHPDGTPVLIVEIDQASLQRFGQWPWPRELMAELIGRIHAQHPTVLGVDILWPEPEQVSRRPGTDHDAPLGDAIGAGPTVLGIAGLREGAGMTGPLTPVLAHGGDPAPALPAHYVLLRSIKAIDGAAAGHGLLSVDKESDGQVRRLPMLAAVGGVSVPSFTLEILRVAVGADHIDAYVERSAVVGVAVGDALALPTEPDGAIRLALSPSDPRRFVSAATLLDGTLPADTLTERFVLLGVTGLGLIDRVTTPLGQMVGIELHAQLLESVIEGRLAARPRWASAAEAALLALAGLLLIALLPGRRLIWYLPAGLLAAGGFIGLAVGAWATHLWLIDAVLPSLGLGGVLTALIGGSYVEANAQRRRLQRQLDIERESAARLAGELEAARRIQMGILPKPGALAPDARFDLDAVLEPAKEIGGDLYDFFPVDARHLFVAVGDVTGKGVPASLFMALGKSLYKSCVLRGSLDPAAIMTAANAEISRDNPEMLFITLFAGLLDLDTGVLTYCNAGHEPPYAVLPGAAPAMIAGSGGPPLCVVDDFPYPAETYHMRPGELLCLVTDGITEAMDRDGALLGHAPVLACLQALPAGARATDALAALRGAVAAFVGDAEPSDDLTAVTVRWMGPSA